MSKGSAAVSNSVSIAAVVYTVLTVLLLSATTFGAVFGSSCSVYFGVDGNVIAICLVHVTVGIMASFSNHPPPLWRLVVWFIHFLLLFKLPTMQWQ